MQYVYEEYSGECGRDTTRTRQKAGRTSGRLSVLNLKVVMVPGVPVGPRFYATPAISSNSRAIHSLDTTTKDGIYPAVSARFAARRMKPARARVAFQCSPLSNAFTGLCQSPARENAPNKGFSRTSTSEYFPLRANGSILQLCIQKLIRWKSVNRLPGLLFPSLRTKTPETQN